MSDKVAEFKNEENTQAPHVPLVLTVDEVAHLLKVNRKTIYEMVNRNQLPGVVRVGRKIRISAQAVVSWLNGQGRPSRASKRRLE